MLFCKRALVISTSDVRPAPPTPCNRSSFLKTNNCLNVELRLRENMRHVCAGQAGPHAEESSRGEGYGVGAPGGRAQDTQGTPKSSLRIKPTAEMPPRNRKPVSTKYKHRNLHSTPSKRNKCVSQDQVGTLLLLNSSLGRGSVTAVETFQGLRFCLFKKCVTLQLC